MQNGEERAKIRLREREADRPQQEPAQTALQIAVPVIVIGIELGPQQELQHGARLGFAPAAVLDAVPHRQEAEHDQQILGWGPVRLKPGESLCRFLFRPSFDPLCQLSFRSGHAAEAEFQVLERTPSGPGSQGDILALNEGQIARLTAIAERLAGLDDCDLAARDGISIQCELHRASGSHQILISSPSAVDCPYHHAMLAGVIALGRQVFPACEASFIRLGQYLKLI